MKALALACVLAAPAHADPLRLRADALATTASPAGLVSIEAIGDAGPRTTAEAVVWTANDVPDVLVMTLRGRTADNRASGELGRFVATLGALRPIHVDGAGGRLRLPARVDVEAYAGVPVQPGLTSSRTWDWVAGGRVARRIGDWGSVGVAYLEEHQDGQLAIEEAGVDAGAAIGAHDDAAGKLAYDLANPGLAEATLTATHKTRAQRWSVYAGYRAASHLLPATSLFTVLGDVPAERAGVAWSWRAAPRLDVDADAGVRHVAGFDDSVTAMMIDGRGMPGASFAADTAPELTVRAKLRLDDRGASALTGEARRDGVGGSAWTGLRGTARIELTRTLAASSEVELVFPDGGGAWPWALAALAYARGPWQAAIAIEALRSPAYNHRVDALVQLGRRFGS